MRFILSFSLLAICLACGSGDGGTGSNAPSAATGGDGASTGATSASGTGEDAGTTGTPDDPPFVCASADDCDGNLICDCLGRCVEPGLPEIASCAEDKNCGSGNYCDTCAGVCRVLKSLCSPCEADGECLDGGACMDFVSGGRFCLRACAADPGCPQPGFNCVPVDGQVQKQCVPLSGICTAPALCTEDSACPYGEICQQGQCAPGCVEDEACPNGQVCAQFRCVDMCAEANPCPVEQICDEGGHCKIEGGCLEPKDCIEPETYCDLSSNLCKAGCLEDFDCKSSGKICDNGTCVDKGCTANYFCSFGQVCNLGTGACEQAVGPYCEAGCEQGAETACEGKPNLCLGLQDKDGNDAGNFCFVACSPDPQNACPQGYSCEEFEHPEDGVVYPICARDCLVEPLGG